MKAFASYAVAAVLSAVLTLFSHGDTVFQFATSKDFVQIPSLTVNATVAGTLLTLVLLGAAGWAWFLRSQRRTPSVWVSVLVGIAFVLSFLTWAGAGRDQTVIPMVTLLAGALSLSVPLIFGSMAGCVGERSGTINIAIEGQLLFGAFLGAVIASVVGNAWLGLLVAPLAGMAVSLLLVLFGLKYRVDQIIVGVVLNVLVLGLTSFFYSTVLNASTESRAHFNSGISLPIIEIPVLAQIPVIGPVFFRQTILVYIMYVVVAALQYMLFRSRWGLRMRACGEHPQAADTVGINVMRTRINNALLGGALAGMGGAFFTIGHGLAFSKDMASGNGYIALAAMILGGWSPIGGVAAALLFGFAMNLGYTLSIIGSPMPSQIVLMIPYVVTILAIAGFVGKVRPPAAEGVPYP
nr:ABC transporter permease [Actinomyces vulturis]